MEENVTVLSPFLTDYGCHSKIGHNSFINHNAYLMDGGSITIGHYCFIGQFVACILQYIQHLPEKEIKV